jgi:hypothetical protein
MNCNLGPGPEPQLSAFLDAVLAVQALYRVGSTAKAAVPALLAAATDKGRLFRESVILALCKIEPKAATGV